MSISFIIATCITNEIQYKQLKRCVNSIFKYSDYNNIYIINNSNDEYNNDILNKLLESYKNIIIKECSSRKKGGTAFTDIFKLILEVDDNSDYFFIIQDSMFLNKKIKDISYVKDVQFLWHFTNHRIHWDHIYVTPSQFNIENNIINHTDLIEYYLKTYYIKDKGFLEYALSALKNKNTWCGCFGICSIITKNTIKYMDDKCSLIKIYDSIHNREISIVNESIFALLCHYYFPKNYEESFDGLYYDGYKSNKNAYKPIYEDNLQLLAANEYISKISFTRLN